MSRVTELQVNGKAHRVDGEWSLLNVLRNDLDSTGTKLFVRAAVADCNRRRLW